ncbi:MAG TPA: radical SAM protein, partial [Terriglobales bacterium]
EYFTLEARSILNRCDAPRMPFRWTVNPYRGCEFACRYCYARYTHEFMEIRDNLEFERQIFVKQNVRQLLRRDLRKVKKGEGIAIGSATDPYQPAERRYEATRAILEELAEHRGLDINMISKSDMVVRDLDLLERIAANNSFYMNFTITTLDPQLARILEPRAPRPDLRLHALEELRKAGIEAGVIVAPVLPAITDQPESLEAIVASCKKAHGCYIFANALFLKSCSASVFLPFIEREFPHLLQQYKKRFARSSFTSSEYRKRLSELMKKLRRKHGIHYRERTAPPEFEPTLFDPAPQQLGLFNGEVSGMRVPARAPRAPGC